MKTIYKCDVCGEEFPDWEACHGHEKVCEELHATGIRLAKDINAAIKTATEHGGVEIGIYCDDPRVYRLVSAKYSARAKQINLEIDVDNQLKGMAETEGANNGGN